MGFTRLTPEARRRREKNKKIAKIILIKIPLVLWILLSVITCLVTPTDLFGFFAVMLFYGLYVVPWVIIVNFLINHWN